MKRFVITPDAYQDLADIFAYIARSSPEAALRVVREIRASIHKAAAKPDLGHLRPDLTDEPFRFLAVYSYLIIYREPRPIRVVRIVHGSRDVAAILGK